MGSERVVKHLWEAARTLTSDKHVTQLIKSNYINICRTILGPSLPDVSTHMCKFCSSYWSENDFKLKLISRSKLAQSSKSRNLIAKLEKSEKTQEKLLTKKQKRRAKWLRKCANTKLEILCTFCGHKTRQPLEKPKKEPQIKVEETKKEELPLKPHKKKKRKDKTAGLKLEAIKNSTKTPEDSKKILPTIKKVQIKQPEVEVKKPKPQPQTKTVNKPKANIQPTQKTKKPTKNSKTPVVSKTQYTNKLLQLAEMLKKQKKNSNVADKRLQALMK